MGRPTSIFNVDKKNRDISSLGGLPIHLMAMAVMMLFVGGCGQDPIPEQVRSEVQKVSKIPIPAWTEHAVFAEVELRDYQVAAFGPSGLTTDISRMANLGINALILSPVFPGGRTFETTSTAVCESIQDYRSSDPSLGTWEELRSLIAQCHDSGIRVILDWPVNNAGFDNVWIDQHQLWFKRTDDNRFVKRTIEQENCLATFDYYNNAMRRGMIDALLYWVDECQIDGFRFDYDATVSRSFWEELHEQFVQKEHTVLLMGRSGAKASYPSTYLHIREGGDVSDVLNSLDNKERDGSPVVQIPGSDANILKANGLFYYNTMRVNPGNRPYKATLSDEDLANCLFVLTYSGVPIISHDMMQALIENKGDSKFNVVRSLIDLKKGNLALINDPYLQNTSVIESNGDRVHYKREVGLHRVDVLVNLGSREYIQKFSAEYKGEDLLTGEREHWYPQVDLKLAPHGFRVLIKR